MNYGDVRINSVIFVEQRDGLVRVAGVELP